MSESAKDAILQNKESAVFAPLKAPRPIYGANVIRTLEANWEAGWLSPGGVEDLAALLERQDISGLNVLDIGVGAGGPAISLLKKFGAGHVTGIDVERPVLERAAALAQEHGVAGQLELVHVAPGGCHLWKLSLTSFSVRTVSFTSPTRLCSSPKSDAYWSRAGSVLSVTGAADRHLILPR